MFIAMQLSSGKNIENGWGFIKPNESDSISTIEHTCSMIAGDFHLTEREAEVLLLLARGKTKKEIAEELYVSQNTIKTHQRNLYTKLDVHSLDELRQFVAHQQGAFDSHGEIWATGHRRRKPRRQATRKVNGRATPPPQFRDCP